MTVQGLATQHAGRRAGELAEVLVLLWDYELNGSIDVTNSGEQQRYFRAGCGDHRVLISPKALLEHHPSGYACHICERQADSQHELRVRGALAQLGMEYIVYARVLGGSFASADMYLHAFDMVVMVDGPGHIDEYCKSVSIVEQHEIDARFDARACELGVRVLRLHYRDVEHNDARVHVQRALAYACMHPRTAFIRFSKRYLDAGKQPSTFAARRTV